MNLHYSRLLFLGILVFTTQAQDSLELELFPTPQLTHETLDSETYFYQSSTDLLDWGYLPDYVIGDGQKHSTAIDIESSQKGFFRYQSTATNLDDPHDTDGDGLTNEFELTGFTTPYNPLSADTDNNGIRDGDENPDGDEYTNREEQDNGSNPNLVMES